MDERERILEILKEHENSNLGSETAREMIVDQIVEALDRFDRFNDYDHEDR
jgi:hypothetical protein